MTTSTVRHLHAVTPDEATVLEKRARAWARFLRRYDSTDSRRTMQGALDRVARTFSGGALSGSTFPWELLCDDDLAAEVWTATLKKFSHATARRDASAVKVMLECCWKEGLLTYDQMQLATSFRVTKGDWSPQPGRTLSDEEMAAFIAYESPAASPALRSRDRALILTMASTGARRREISHLLLANLDLAERSIRLEVTKNGDPRDAFLHPTAATSLTEWLDVRGLSPGPLLVALSRTGRPLLDRKLSEHQMWKIVRRRSEECGIGAVTPHDMRRFVVTRLLEEGHDLLLVSRLVGHSDPSVTKLYDRRPIDSFRAAIATLPLGVQQAG
jgi:integrase